MREGVRRNERKIKKIENNSKRENEGEKIREKIRKRENQKERRKETENQRAKETIMYSSLYFQFNLSIPKRDLQQTENKYDKHLLLPLFSLESLSYVRKCTFII